MKSADVSKNIGKISKIWHFLKSSEKMPSNEWSPILNGQAAEKLWQFEYKQK